jgi:hypothetical protein
MGVGSVRALLQIISGNFWKYRFQPTKPIAESTSTPHPNLSFASGGLPQRRCCERTVREHSTPNHALHRFRFRFRPRPRFSKHTRLGWLVREVSRRGRRGRGGVFDLVMGVGNVRALLQIISGNFWKYRFQPTKPIAEITSTPLRTSPSHLRVFPVYLSPSSPLPFYLPLHIFAGTPMLTILNHNLKIVTCSIGPERWRWRCCGRSRTFPPCW